MSARLNRYFWIRIIATLLLMWPFTNDCLFGQQVTFKPRITIIPSSSFKIWGTNLGDINNDGHLDLVISRNGQIYWYRNNGYRVPDFTPSAISIEPQDYFVPKLIDYDGDGDMDIIGLSATEVGAVLVWYENLGGALPNFTRRTFITKLNGVLNFEVADLNHDGFSDIVLTGDNRLMWLRGNGAQPYQFTSHTISTSAIRPYDFCLADLNNDGHLDIVVNSTGDQKIYWFANNGRLDAQFAERKLYDIGGYYGSFLAHDMDSDGDLDIVHDNYWFDNQGGASPAFLLRQMVPNSSTIRFLGMIAADLNADGRIDFLSAWDRSIYWLENKGGNPPTFSFHEIDNQVSNWFYSYCIGDLNGDHDLDVVTQEISPSDGPWSEREVFYYESLLQPDRAPVTLENWFHYR